MRDLDWPGCWNARDLGGLRTLGGALTRSGQIVRSDAPDALTDAGWRAVEAYGIRTIIDLRNPDQVVRPTVTPPSGIRIHNLALELDLARDPALVELANSGAWATSIYLGAFFTNWPERVVRILETIADAPEGGVLVHCKKGSDRTGVVSLALLGIANVEPEESVADYMHTAARLVSHGAACGAVDDADRLRKVYEKLGSTPRAGVLAGLEIWQRVQSTMVEATMTNSLDP